MINTDNFRITKIFVCNKNHLEFINGNCISNYFAKERIATGDTFFKQLDLYRRRTSVCGTAKDRRLLAFTLFQQSLVTTKRALSGDFKYEHQWKLNISTGTSISVCSWPPTFDKGSNLEPSLIQTSRLVLDMLSLLIM